MGSMARWNSALTPSCGALRAPAASSAVNGRMVRITVCLSPSPWFPGLAQRVVVVRSLLELQGRNVVRQRLIGARSQVHRLIESTAGIGVQVTHFDQRSGWRNREIRGDRDVPDGNPLLAATVPDAEDCTALAAVLREYRAGRRSRELELHLRALRVRPPGGIHGVAELEDHAFPLTRLHLGERLALAGFRGESPDDLHAGARG